MRIALVSTPFLPVPPPAYGGTELVVGDLAVALRARGHEVVVYATGDSCLPGIEIRHYFVNSQWPPDPAVDAMHGAFCMRDILRDPRGFDAVHIHDIGTVSLARHLDFRDAVSLGVFAPLGDGSLDLRGTLGALRAEGYSGWLIVEQDVRLGVSPIAAPLRDAMRSRAYLTEVLAA